MKLLNQGNVFKYLYRFSLMFSVIVLSSQAIFAQQNKTQDLIDLKLNICLDSTENQNTAGMCNCTYRALDNWDKKLNLTYKSLIVLCMK